MAGNVRLSHEPGKCGPGRRRLRARGRHQPPRHPRIGGRPVAGGTQSPVPVAWTPRFFLSSGRSVCDGEGERGWRRPDVPEGKGAITPPDVDWCITGSRPAIAAESQGTGTFAERQGAAAGTGGCPPVTSGDAEAAVVQACTGRRLAMSTKFMTAFARLVRFQTRMVSLRKAGLAIGRTSTLRPRKLIRLSG